MYVHAQLSEMSKEQHRQGKVLNEIQQSLAVQKSKVALIATGAGLAVGAVLSIIVSIFKN